MSHTPMLDRLLRALRAARAQLAAHDGVVGRTALDQAFAELGAAYAAIDPMGSPEVTAHLIRMYDTCVRHIGESGPGKTRGLEAAIALVSSLRDAMTERGHRRAAGIAAESALLSEGRLKPSVTRDARYFPPRPEPPLES